MGDEKSLRWYILGTLWFERPGIHRSIQDLRQPFSFIGRLLAHYLSRHQTNGVATRECRSPTPETIRSIRFAWMRLLVKLLTTWKGAASREHDRNPAV